jgi:hypothetical protein
MKTELYTKNSENLKLQSDNTVMKADSQTLTEEIQKLRKRAEENEVCLANISSVSAFSFFPYQMFLLLNYYFFVCRLVANQ